MKIQTLCLLLLVISGQAAASQGFELGFFAGTSYYMGNINPVRHFYNLSPVGGLQTRYNFNEHYSFRGGLNYGTIKGSDHDFRNILHQTRGAEFVNNFYDLSVQAEFNFHPFKTDIFSNGLTTYITAGLSFTVLTGTTETEADFINIPFGAGIKYGLSRKVTIGMEWILKKSFTDTIDGVRSFGQFNSPSLVHNNDWVSLAGIFITVKPFERRGDCPAYWN